MKYIKLSQWAKLNCLTYMSAYNYYKKGLIENIKLLPTGTILVGINNNENKQQLNRVITYSRVSSNQMKENLNRQDQRLYDFATSHGYIIVDRITEIGSGMNDHRSKLIGMLNRDDYDILIVEHKDRLTRFGFNYIKTLLSKLNKQIIVINNSEDDKIDIMNDLISIVYSFSARIYGKRRNKNKIDQAIEQIKQCN